MNRDKFMPYHMIEIMKKEKLNPKIISSKISKNSDRDVNVNLFDKSIDTFFDKKTIPSKEGRRKESLEIFEEYLESKYNIEPDY